MTCLGHISWQQKQRMQVFVVDNSLPLPDLDGVLGQLSAHLPQPTHSFLRIFGVGVAIFLAAGRKKLGSRSIKSVLEAFALTKSGWARGATGSFTSWHSSGERGPRPGGWPPSA